MGLDFKKVNFGFREYRIPLFWITHPKHNIFRRKVIAFYKNLVTHVYYLDNEELRVSEQGYKFFRSKDGFKKYKKEAKRIIELIEKKNKDCKKLDLKKESDERLKKAVVDFFGVMNAWGKIYAITEPQNLAKIEEEEKKFGKLIKEIGETRYLLREKGRLLWVILFHNFLKEIVRRYNLKVRDIFFYTFEEMMGLFSGKKPKREVLEKRKSGYAVICRGNMRIILTGEKFKKLYKEIVSAKSEKDVLIGRTVMKGKARGRVRLVLHDRLRIKKAVLAFKKGEILVTEMTRPDTIWACRKASAIITDEGGITSHAAIISRELKVPCIVGTKIATQVLKDGMIVEVDADKGIVKIIKKD